MFHFILYAGENYFDYFDFCLFCELLLFLSYFKGFINTFDRFIVSLNCNYYVLILIPILKHLVYLNYYYNFFDELIAQ